MKKIAFLFLIGFIFASCCKDTDIQYYPAELRNMLPYFPGQIIKFADENQDTVVLRCESAQDVSSEGRSQNLFCSKPKSKSVSFEVKFSRLDTLQSKVWTFDLYNITKFNSDWYLGIYGSDESMNMTSEILIRGKKFENILLKKGSVSYNTLDTVVLSNSGIIAFTSQKTNSLFVKIN